MRFLGIFLVVFGLDLGQISFNLVENAFGTRQLAFLATDVAFTTFGFEHGFSIFGFFFRLSFSSFSFLFAAVIDLLLG